MTKTFFFSKVLNKTESVKKVCGYMTQNERFTMAIDVKFNLLLERVTAHIWSIHYDMPYTSVHHCCIKINCYEGM